ncbi:hypothetical protein ABMA28_002780 [Loxostege sticticalis]|uniref:Uncharacterized protein n=1 Tax=Loxostege sticticalis TaxID=481309 RepID=A0ABD0SY90_LOXSC
MLSFARFGYLPDLQTEYTCKLININYIVTKPYPAKIRSGLEIDISSFATIILSGHTTKGTYPYKVTNFQNKNSPLPSSFASKNVLSSTCDRAQCPPAADGMERFACPTPDRQGRYRCIDDHVLCDGFIDCPSGEDEDRQACMFYKTRAFLLAYRYHFSLLNHTLLSLQGG